MFGLNRLEADFRDASNKMVQLSAETAAKISQEVRLECYGYYKQATIGDNNTSQPQLMIPKENLKWWAWRNIKGMSREEAMRRYIEVTAVFRNMDQI